MRWFGSTRPRRKQVQDASGQLHRGVSKWARVGGFAAVVVLAATGAFLWGPSSLSAVSAACNPGRTPSSGHWWDGWIRGPGTAVGGTYATIDNYSSYVYGSSITAVYSLITDTGNGHYAQVGWYQQPSAGYRDVFTEYVNTSSQTIRNIWDYPAGSSDVYNVEYDPISKITTFTVDGNQLQQVVVSYLPNQGEVLGEVLNFASQMVGGNDDPVSLSGTRIYYSGGWQVFAGDAVNYDVHAYGNTVQNSGTDDIWDLACSY